MQRIKNIYLLFFIFIFLVISCNGNPTDKVNAFLSEYISTVSMEHAIYKKNITEKMKDYYIDIEGEKTDMPYLVLLGSYRDNIVIVRDYEILYTKEVEIGDYKKCYESKVRFTIENNKNVPYQKDEIYLVCVHKNRFYVCMDEFIKDIFILEKDLQLMEQRNSYKKR